ncbi:thermonuclease family protein [Rhizobium sp. 32-5/1]|uniref:thermonuclease family protein n=1 Tax=Rhizobium sp. 32-5/1 TaxID=3019602 RepID=UPI00240DAE4C|nr:thermonuclease family protein [Rhizobium sp. 32-5/1]WEZ83263.1 thermonuclease family protein [Rhizobium sp. 32-5/1]
MRLTTLLRDLLLCILIFLFMGLIVVRMSSGPGETVSGDIRIIDGDTLAVSGVRVRIIGMDAPELAQTCARDGRPWPCGKAARDRLTEIAGAGAVFCTLDGNDRYGRNLGTCAVGSMDLGETMVRQGYAVAFGRYEREEAAAQNEGLGLWSGTFERPRTWRETHGGMTEAPHIAGDWMTWLWSRIWHDGD